MLAPSLYGLLDLSRMLKIIFLQKKLRRIKAIVSDVDGVLTDGKIYLSATDEIKVFCCKDAPRTKMAIDSGIIIVYYTGRPSEPVKRRAEERKIPVIDKRSVPDIFSLTKDAYHVNPEEIMYIGDDLNDLPGMKKAGVAVAPRDASAENKKVAHIVTKAKGGEGVLSEAIEILMRAQGTWDRYLKEGN